MHDRRVVVNERKRSPTLDLTLLQPSDSVVHPVYNPQPGSWFAVAYIEKEDEDEEISWSQWLERRISLRKCR